MNPKVRAIFFAILAAALYALNSPLSKPLQHIPSTLMAGLLYLGAGIGVGMMTRGEVALIVAQKALVVGALRSNFFTAVILMIIITSIVTPFLLRVLYRKQDSVQAVAK